MGRQRYRISSSTSSAGASCGLGVSEVVGIVFIILKLVGVIDWSWWVVLMPIYIPIVLVVFAILIYVSIFLIVMLKCKLGK